MRTRDLTKTGSQIALLIGQTILILLCIAYINYIYFTNIYPDKHVKENFEQTDCFVMSKRLASKGHLFPKYRADFRVSYNVGNAQYSKWVSGNGLDYSYTHSSSDEQAILDQFQEGTSYPCWYNPDNSAQVVLVLRHGWSSTFPLMIPSAIALLMLYYFLKTLFQVMGKATIKVREVRKKRKKKLEK